MIVDAVDEVGVGEWIREGRVAREILSLGDVFNVIQRPGPSTSTSTTAGYSLHRERRIIRTMLHQSGLLSRLELNELMYPRLIMSAQLH